MFDALDERSGTRVPLLPQAGGRKADVRREFSAPGDSNRLRGIFTAGLRAYGRLKDLMPLGRGVLVVHPSGCIQVISGPV